MKKVIIFILCLLPMFIFANEKVVDFKIEQKFMTQKWHLVNESGDTPYGHLSIHKEFSHFMPGFGSGIIYRFVAEDNTEPPFKGVVAIDDILKLAEYRNGKLLSLALLCVYGSMSLTFGITGATMAAMSEVNSNYGSFFYPGIALSVIGGVFLLATLIVMSFFIYNTTMLKKVKKRVISILNGEIKSSKITRKLKVRFSIVVN